MADIKPNGNPDETTTTTSHPAAAATTTPRKHGRACIRRRDAVFQRVANCERKNRGAEARGKDLRHRLQNIHRPTTRPRNSATS